MEMELLCACLLSKTASDGDLSVRQRCTIVNDSEDGTMLARVVEGNLLMKYAPYLVLCDILISLL
jgi:hypothetical protein